MPSQTPACVETPNDPQFGLLDLIPERVKDVDCALTGARLNLVIPTIARQTRSFGGPATAIRLFERLTPEFDFARIVVTHEMESEVDSSDWPGWIMDRGVVARRTMAFLGNKTAPLAVAPSDFFIATFWSTAVYVKHIVRRQRLISRDANRRFVYLVQEYEPAFYPGGARYEYAKSTYRDDGTVIPVFNSRPVTNYFRDCGLLFSEQYEFEPMFHPQLLQWKADIGELAKERLILVYGRPGFEQNGFDLIVEALRVWAHSYTRADEWSLVSAGLPHADVLLRGEIVLRSVGTLSLDQYALTLRRCWVGLSFAFNASTSYSAREMAEFGAWVVTNQFEYRKLSELPPSVICVDESTPEAVAERLAWCCEQYQPGQMAAVANLPPVFKREGDEFPFVNDLMTSWRKT